MLLNSTRFGQLDIPDDVVLQFPDGLPGFPDETKFAMIPYDKNVDTFAYLQSVTDPDLTLLLVNPFTFFRHYSFEIDDAWAKQFGFTGDPEQLSVYTIVTVPDKMAEMTTNLMSPIMINWQTRKAEQIILLQSPYGAKTKLFPHGLPSKPPSLAKV